MATTRAEHLAWCKQRALKYIEAGDLQGAFASFSSDLGKEESTRDSQRIQAELGMPQLMGGMLDTPEKMRNWIEGFN